MNNYERIQKAIDYIEENLTRKIFIEKAAEASFFSSAQFYRIFFAITGLSVKSYIRRRRIFEASKELRTSQRIILDIAIEYQFESQESFTRALKKEYGVTPGIFRKENSIVPSFEKLNIMEKYFLDVEESYIDPKIKVLKELPIMRVAYYSYVGESPEREAWKVLIEWGKENGIIGKDYGYRLFGYDLPGKKPEDKIYGYETWITVPEETEESGLIKIKVVQGGLYAVTNCRLYDIVKAWQNFAKWLGIAAYEYGEHQWLEEHISPLEKWNDNVKIDLYMPIRRKK